MFEHQVARAMRKIQRSTVDEVAVPIGFLLVVASVFGAVLGNLLWFTLRLFARIIIFVNPVVFASSLALYSLALLAQWYLARNERARNAATREIFLLDAAAQLAQDMARYSGQFYLIVIARGGAPAVYSHGTADDACAAADHDHAGERCAVVGPKGRITRNAPA